MISQNKIKFIKSLQLKKNRLKEKLFIVEGKKMVHELIKSDFTIYQIFATSEWILSNNISSVELIEISESDLLRISNLRTPNQVLAIVHITNFQIPISDIKKGGLCLVLDRINNPGNLGTIIRLCDWFSVNHLICSEDTVDVFNPKVVQATMGSLFRVQIEYRNLVVFLNKINGVLPIYASCMDGEDIMSTKCRRDSVLLLGSESHGISPNLIPFFTERVGIKNIGNQAESLNVAVATGILLHAFSHS